jgi:uncharacterized membrane protein
MQTVTATPFLRFALLVDAVASGATGLMLAAAAAPLAPLLGLPEALLRGVGLFFLPYAAAVAFVASRAAPARLAVRVIIVLNLIWVVESVLFAALGPALAGLAPTALGLTFVLGQAGLVLGFAVAQAMALRRAGPAAAPILANS